MLRKLILIPIILIGVSLILMAQDDELDNLSFETYELQETSPLYFAVGGGFTGSFIFLDFDALNSEIIGLNFEESNIFMMGAEGFTAIPYLKNFRLGFSSIGGMFETKGQFEAQDIDIRYSIDFKGISFDYAIVPLSSFAIMPGVNAGWGSLLLERIYNKESMLRSEGDFWAVKPHINLEYALAEYLMVRLGGAYSFTFMSDWKNNYLSSSDITTDINGNGMEITFGIYIGVFTY